MKILISAYACEPGVGSEPEVGMKAAIGAARAGHEVWLVTRENNRQKVEDHLATLAFRHRIHLDTFDLSPISLRWKKKLGELGMHLYYDRWQRRLADRAVRLAEEVDFDVVHHVTFATYWTRAGVSLVDRPFVWGPIGGGVEAPIRLVPLLGVKGTIRDVIRFVVRRCAELAPHLRATIRKADITLAQNPETAARLRGARSVRVVPNATSAVPDAHPGGGPRTTDVLFVGRLIPYKAGVLAIRAMAAVRHPHSRLIVIGDGPDRARMRTEAQRLGIDGRVDFLGRIPRSEVFDLAATAGVILHTALHDDSPLSIAEALALGTPLVCLDRGGPPVVCRHFESAPHAIVSVRGGPSAVAARLAREVERHLAQSPPIPTDLIRPDIPFEQQLLGAYADAIGSSAVT